MDREPLPQAYNAPMRCNIDARGRLARLICGILTLIASITLVVLSSIAVLTAWWWWLIAALLAIGGGFQIFEAATGWCIMRAMGFKTPM
jgi:hypothetical protein